MARLPRNAVLTAEGRDVGASRRACSTKFSFRLMTRSSLQGMHPEDHRQTASKECDHVQLKDLEVASRVDDRDRSQHHRPAEIGRDEQGDGAGAID